jgi:hypothetical protein
MLQQDTSCSYSGLGKQARLSHVLQGVVTLAAKADMACCCLGWWCT